ncbi:hypothetical protein BHE74_00022695, partial [Ensete ventricosum]
MYGSEVFETTQFDKIVITIKVFHTDLYRPYRAVRTSPPGYQYADRPLPGDTAKIDRQRSIEREIDRRRSIEGEKGKTRRRGKEERRGEEERIPRAVLTRMPSPPTRRLCVAVALARE